MGLQGDAMTDRLRRLDSLFAERVLGRTVGFFSEKLIPPGHFYEDGWWWSHPKNVGHILAEGGVNPLPRYTRSLDAAWEGAVKVRERLAIYGNARLTLELDDIDGFCVEIHSPGQGQKLSRFASVSVLSYSSMVAGAFHPAEALVLACLKAVGCTEEELA